MARNLGCEGGQERNLSTSMALSFWWDMSADVAGGPGDIPQVSAVGVYRNGSTVNHGREHGRRR